MSAKSLIISSDSHVVEPPQLWSDRMDTAHGERIPHLEVGDPHDQWHCDGEVVGTLGGASSAGMRFSRPEDIILEGSFANVPPGGYDPHAHVQDLDVDGVYGSVLYSSVAGNMYAVPDAAFMREVFTAYNRWLSEFCSAYPRRLKGIAQVLVDDDMAAGIVQLEHAAKLGLCGAMIPVYPSPSETYDLPMYDPLWAAAQDLGIPLSLHVGTKRPGSVQMRTEGRITQSAAERSVSDFWVRMSLGHMVFSGVFERFPDLRVVNVEHELSWIPFFMKRMDATYVERHTQATHRFQTDALPSDFMRQNIYHGFQEDELGIRLRDIIGVDHIMWGSDYPHAESTFPESQRILDEIMTGVPDEERAMMVGGNCAELYGLG